MANNTVINGNNLILHAGNGDYYEVASLLKSELQLWSKNKALIASSENGHCGIVGLLLRHGADIHTKDDEALKLSARNGHYDVVCLLLAHGSNVHADNDYALRLSATHGHPAIVKVLLENGADIYSSNALRLAITNNHYPVAKLLLKNGADVKAQNNNALQTTEAAFKKHAKEIYYSKPIEINNSKQMKELLEKYQITYTIKKY